MANKFIGWNKEKNAFTEPFYLGSVLCETHYGPVENYVGIDDIDKKEIYSSFILEFNHGENQTIAEVVFDAPAFCLKIIQSPLYKSGVIIQWDLSWFKNPRIIGNIYEGYTK